MNLVIVESPAKARTIEGYLGGNFNVVSSYGHVRDLPKTKLGVEIEHKYKPQYHILASARANIAKIKQACKKADKIYLATDYDREGEAIAWHLTYALGGAKSKKEDSRYLRITFTEITKQAIKRSIAKPRQIDMNLVDAQQARRILDRLVGYKLSPFLWKKIARGLSAGRVQSVAVRLIVEREREIEKFKPQQYWQIMAILAKKGEKDTFKAGLCAIDGKKVAKLEIRDEKEAKKIKSDLDKAEYKINKIDDKKRNLSPSAPYRTATLQQDAARRLRFSAKKTMFVAQKLYEGVDLGKGKRVGLITYMRTDSTNLSAGSIQRARKYIETKLSKKYLPDKAQIYRTKNVGAQEAHEAVRPTDPMLEPVKIKQFLSNEQYRLYDLIWRRMVASQCSQAQIADRKVEIKAKKYTFQAKGRAVQFDGFLKIYSLGLSDIILPPLKVGEVLDLSELQANQKQTEPKARYTEATLVKELEKRGIGRPSTYAPTMSTIQDRNYVEKISGYFHPEEIGTMVNDLLVNHFSEVVDYDFTRKMEDDLDDVARGDLVWSDVVDEFYRPFSKHLKLKEKTIKKEDVAQQKTGKKCPQCKKGEVIIKMGRYGRFYACSNFPECEYKQKMEVKKKKLSAEDKKSAAKAEELLKKNKKCAKCGKEMVVRQSRFGTFLGCSGYPECRNIIPVQQEGSMKCPKCRKGMVVKRFTRKGKVFWGCSKYPECDFASWTKPNDNSRNKN